MKNWVVFLLYAPWCNQFAVLLRNIVVEFASSDIGLALEGFFTIPFFLQISLYIFVASNLGSACGENLFCTNR